MAVMYAILITPAGGKLFATPNGFLSISPKSIFTYTPSLTLSSYHMRRNTFIINNFSFSIDRNIANIKEHLYGDTLVVFSTITDTIDVYLYDTSCIKHVLRETIPLLKDVVVKDNMLTAITYLGETELDITVNTHVDKLKKPSIILLPTIDNLSLKQGSIPAWVNTTATYTYNGYILHIGDDIYPTASGTWYTRDHINYRNITSNLYFRGNSTTWFIGNMPITATISKIWGPVIYTYAYREHQWKKYQHKLILDDTTMAIKAKDFGYITIGQNQQELFVAFSSTQTTIFFIYSINNNQLKFKETKTFPDLFLIRGSYAISPSSGYIMKLGTWGAPIPPTKNIGEILIDLPFVISNSYLDSLHIRWCKDGNS